MKKWRILLFPFGFLYGIITAVRNLLFDFGIKKTYKIPVKSICVGNLSVGGTGKTPHVAYLAALLQTRFEVQILSRGYGRSTKGFIMLDENADSEMVGDEPLLYFRNFPSVTVAVCESRKTGIQNLLKLKEPDVVLLDDAFQHRPVKAGLNILLTDFKTPYYKDLMLPAGDLREWKCGKKRADIVIVTKCPENISNTVKQKMIQRLQFKPSSIYFSKIKYGSLLPFENGASENFQNILLVTGIANPLPLEIQLRQKYNVELIKFPDHHAFTLEDIGKIHKKFDTFATENKVIVTTEKDFVRLMHPELKNSVLQRPWFYQEITIEIDRETEFKKEITDYVETV